MCISTLSTNNVSDEELIRRIQRVCLKFNSSEKKIQSKWHRASINFSSVVAQTVKASAYNVRDLGSIPGLGRSPGEGNGSPLQYCCLENSMDRGSWWATAHRAAEELDTT